MTACIEGHHDIVQLLLEHEADLEMLDKDGKSAEDLAKENNNVQLVLYRLIARPSLKIF